MARLSLPPNSTTPSNPPLKDRIQLALDFLYKNPTKKPATAVCLYKIKMKSTIRQAWYREKKREEKKGATYEGHNRILRPDQY